MQMLPPRGKHTEKPRVSRYFPVTPAPGNQYPIAYANLTLIFFASALGNKFTLLVRVIIYHTIAKCINFEL